MSNDARDDRLTEVDAEPETGLTRRQAVGLGAAALAAGAGAAVLAPGIAGATEVGASRPTITAADAAALLAAGVAKAEEIKVPMYLLVVDESNVAKASLRMDGNGLASLTLVPLKAKTAVSLRAPTHVLAERFAPDPVRANSFLAAGFTLIGGGLPITRDGVVIGAIGVGGGSAEQDVVVANAALAALPS